MGHFRKELISKEECQITSTGYEYFTIRMSEIDEYERKGWEVRMRDFPLCPDGINPACALVRRKKKCT